jgi:hypothetical protein
MPVAIVAGQSRRFDCQYGSDPAITHRRQKPAETRALVMAGSGDAEILINDDHLLKSEFPSAVLQRVLTTAAF